MGSYATAKPSFLRIPFGVFPMKTLIILLCFLSLLLLPECTAQARTWYVKPDGTGDALTIQAGIDSAVVGDYVVVECGTYYEHDILMKAGIHLTSSTERAECAIIDAQQRGRVMACVDLDPQGMGTATEIDGFTFTRGDSPCEPNTPWPGSHCNAGGMLIEGSSITIANCIFIDNWCITGVGEFSSSGGGVYCENSTVTLRNCKFTSNGANSGGGMDCCSSSVDLTSCTFDENFAGGLACSGSDVTLTRCLFSRNEAWAALSVYGGNVTVDRSTFSGNSGHQGAGIDWGDLIEGQVLSVTNTIIAFSANGSAFHSSLPEGLGEVNLRCCDIYGNAGGDWTGRISGQAGINGNFSLDPLFCDQAGVDYDLRDSSPCVPENHPAGYNCGGFIGAFYIHCTGTAVTPTTWGKIKSLFR